MGKQEGGVEWEDQQQRITLNKGVVIVLCPFDSVFRCRDCYSPLIYTSSEQKHTGPVQISSPPQSAIYLSAAVGRLNFDSRAERQRAFP